MALRHVLGAVAAERAVPPVLARLAPRGPAVMFMAMNSAAKSVFAFGLYLVVVGLGLLVAPNPFLAPLGFPPVADSSWLRVLGVLTIVIAAYYLLAGRAGLTVFFRWTVSVRIGVFCALGALVLLQLAPAPLALLGTVDLAAALWTALALRSSPVR